MENLNEVEVLNLVMELQYLTGGDAARVCLFQISGVKDSPGPRIKTRGEVCPLSLLIGREINGIPIDTLVDWETAADQYHTLPFQGSWLDQPLWLIQAFDHIRSGKNAATADIQDSITKTPPTKKR